MRRTAQEIRLDILKLCRKSRRITQIVYLCNLNFKIYKRHLEYLIEKGWISETNKIYTTTETGEQTLELLTPAMSLITACLT